MPLYDIKIANSAASDLKKLPKAVQKRIAKTIDALRVTPKPKGVEKLTNHPAFFRKRVGDYRVVYTMLAERALLVVMVIRHRKEAYAGLDNLDNRLSVIVASLQAEPLTNIEPPPLN